MSCCRVVDPGLCSRCTAPSSVELNHLIIYTSLKFDFLFLALNFLHVTDALVHIFLLLDDFTNSEFQDQTSNELRLTADSNRLNLF